MKRWGLASLALLALLTFASQSTALSITMTFQETAPLEYSVTAVGDVAWEALNFASAQASSFTFATGAGEDFDGQPAFSFTSAGVMFMSIVSLAGVPGGATVNVGTFSATAPLTLSSENGGPYMLDTTTPHEINYLPPASTILGSNPGTLADGSGGSVPVYVDVIGATVPEPGTIGLLGAGLAALAFIRRRTA